MNNALKQAKNVEVSEMEREHLAELLLGLDVEERGHYPEEVNGQLARKPAEGGRPEATDPQVPAPERAVIGLDAAENLNVSTPKSAGLYSGGSLHWHSQGDLHYAAGEHVGIAAGKSVGLHCDHGGIQFKAQHGLVSVQAHEGEEYWTARKRLKMTSGEEDVNFFAQKKITVHSGKTAIVLEGENITFYIPAKLDVKSATGGFFGPERRVPGLPVLPVADYSFPQPKRCFSFSR
jgi:uncharacterized protein (DUF2345 family)